MEQNKFEFRQILSTLSAIAVLIFFAWWPFWLDYKNWVGELKVLEVLEKIFIIVGASAVFVAMRDYRYKRSRDIGSDVSEQVSFFREKVLGSDRETYDHIKQKEGTTGGGSRPVIYVCAINPKTRKILPGQEINKVLQIHALEDSAIWKLQTDTINFLEQFALNVTLFGIIDHAGLCPVRVHFVDKMEECARRLEIACEEAPRPMEAHEFSFELYRLWKPLTRPQVGWNF